MKSKYFQEKDAQANERFNSFDAWDDFGGGADDNMSAWNDAEGDAEPQQSVQIETSRPYVVKIQNTSTDDITDVVIFDGARRFALITTTSSGAYGNTAGILISSGIPSTTYGDIVYTSMNQPFVNGMIYASATGDSPSAQIQEIITVEERKADGNIAQRPLIFEVDPYQQQTNVLINRDTFLVDGSCKLTIATLYAETTLTLKFYRALNVDPARSLRGSTQIKDYGSPGIVRKNILEIKPSRGNGRGRLGR
jgi:hypothetical protein